MPGEDRSAERGAHGMEAPRLFILPGVIAALCSGRTDRAARADKKLIKWLVPVCAGLAVLNAILITRAAL